MAARKRASGGPNKSAFIRGVLETNGAASVKDAQEAWKAAGNKDKLNPTLFYQVKSKMGIAGRKKRRKLQRKPTVVESGASSTHEAYLAIEKSLDEMIAQAEASRDGKLAESLRLARRRASAKLL